MHHRRKDKVSSRYAGLASQWAVGLSLTLFGGKRLDHYFDFQNPILSWILPLIFIIGMLIKLIVETNKSTKK